MIFDLLIQEAINILSAKNYGLHLMIIYPDLGALKRFFVNMYKRILKIITDATFCDIIDTVRSFLSNFQL